MSQIRKDQARVEAGLPGTSFLSQGPDRCSRYPARCDLFHTGVVVAEDVGASQKTTWVRSRLTCLTGWAYGPRARPASSARDPSNETQGQEQDYRADEGHEDGARQTAERHGEMELAKEIAPHEGPHNADDDIADHPVAAAHDHGRQPA